jgi:hypothetical protein
VTRIGDECVIGQPIQERDDRHAVSRGDGDPGVTGDRVLDPDVRRCLPEAGGRIDMETVAKALAAFGRSA